MAIDISNTTRRIVYTGSAGTGPYAFAFEVLAETDIAVYFNETELTLTTDYTVSIGGTGTGNVTIVTGTNVPTTPDADDRITIVGDRAIERSTDFTTGGPLFAQSLNDEFDSLTIFTQQNLEQSNRSLRAPNTDPTTIDMTLPINTVRANKTLAFDTDGNPTIGELIGDWRGDWAAGVAYNKRDLIKDTSNDNVYICQVAHTSSGVLPISSNADSAKWDLVVDAASATASAAAAAASASAAATSETNAETAETNAETAETNAAASASAASTSATNAASSATTASTAATNAETSETNAATSATNAASSATSAASSATSATSSATSATASASTATTKASEASTSATTATTKASEASTSATDAATSATASATSATASANSETNAATSETNAATSASTATTKASEASTSATNAASSASTASTAATNAGTSETNAASSASAASTSASSASASASTATTQASNASTSASDASTSASNASTSASAAATSATTAATEATNAAASATSAADSFDSFDDRYLGAKSSAPTTDNDGNTLITGALYWNSTTDKLFIWTGSAWNPAAFDTTGAVLSFNSRTGAVTLTSSDVTDALTYTPLSPANNLSDVTTASTARTNLGLAIGTNVQAWDAQLDDLAALAVTDSNFIVGNGANWVAETGATARTSLGVGTGSDVQFNSIGAGTAGSGTTGEIRATNDVVAYYSDDRLKIKKGNIENALDKVMTLNGFHYTANELAERLGYEVKPEVGVSAQEVQKILPEIVVPAPIDENYLTVHYHKLVPLLIESIKELKQELDTHIEHSRRKQ